MSRDKSAPQVVYDQEYVANLHRPRSGQANPVPVIVCKSPDAGDRAGRPQIEGWYQELRQPDNVRLRFYRRLRTLRSPRESWTALAELYMHNWLVTRLQAKQIHNEQRVGGRNADWLVHLHDGSEIAFEVYSPQDVPGGTWRQSVGLAQVANVSATHDKVRSRLAARAQEFGTVVELPLVILAVDESHSAMDDEAWEGMCFGQSPPKALLQPGLLAPDARGSTSLPQISAIVAARWDWSKAGINMRLRAYENPMADRPVPAALKKALKWAPTPPVPRHRGRNA